MSDRPRSIPELRGHAPIPPERTRSYSALSYAALYGITIEEAEEIRKRCGATGPGSPDSAHRAIADEIMAIFRADKDRLMEAIGAGPEVEASEEEIERARRLSARSMASIAESSRQW